MAASRAFGCDTIAGVCAEIRNHRLHGHLPPVFGFCMAHLGVEEIESVRLFLFLVLRGLVSAAVRLGVVGPLEGQAIQRRMYDQTEALAVGSVSIDREEAAQTAPLLDLLQGTQDRLYSRLFQS